MHVMRLAACVVAGCSTSPVFEHVAAPPDLARPIQVTGNGANELWSVFDDHGATAVIAHSIDYGSSWQRIVVPQLVGTQPVQLATDAVGRVWVAGIGATGVPALVSVVQTHGHVAVIADFSGIFPLG